MTGKPSDPRSIVIVGSSNTDMVIKTSHLPAPGETIIGGNFFIGAGGKGANQAVAASRLGGNVSLVCKTGNDIFGLKAKDQFLHEGIDTIFVLQHEHMPSGIAVIVVDDKGENTIVVAPGANTQLRPADLQTAVDVIASSSIILTQLEIPIDTIEYLAEQAGSNKVRLVVNPAPACRLPDQLFQKIAIITPNVTEAEMLSGVTIGSISDAKLAAAVIKTKGVETVIITLGDKGALLLHEDQYTLVEATPVKAIDTTAAGDVFNGALVVALSENKSIHDAVSFACRAAEISVTRLGAQSSAPYRKEMNF